MSEVVEIDNPKIDRKARIKGYDSLEHFFLQNFFMSFGQMAEELDASYQAVSYSYRNFLKKIEKETKLKRLEQSDQNNNKSKIKETLYV